ncbi:hypothetical protein JTE90_027947 [Oedothorax gibbosus]|uniref:Uncharacterized protein n=1 Tax=Oedothorax gibbosus TaxID=931172 RepID=A0AAV6VH19_9ARAC|nr:hypothetical protein JTE90_027947 [Oedothorax gibbosus]
MEGGTTEANSNQDAPTQTPGTQVRTAQKQLKFLTEEVPEADLDEQKCAICLTSAREYKANWRPVAKTEC